MYHDEFAKKPMPAGDDLIPSLGLEVGGGVSLGLVASLNHPISFMIFYLGALLPMVTCCLTIAARRIRESLAACFFVAVAQARESRRPSAVPRPHLAIGAGRSATRMRRQESTRSAR